MSDLVYIIHIFWRVYLRSLTWLQPNSDHPWQCKRWIFASQRNTDSYCWQILSINTMWRNRGLLHQNLCNLLPLIHTRLQPQRFKKFLKEAAVQLNESAKRKGTGDAKSFEATRGILSETCAETSNEATFSQRLDPSPQSLQSLYAVCQKEANLTYLVSSDIDKSAKACDNREATVVGQAKMI